MYVLNLKLQKKSILRVFLAFILNNQIVYKNKKKTMHRKLQTNYINKKLKLNISAK